MKTNVKEKSGRLFSFMAAITLAIATLPCTACPNNAGGSGGKTYTVGGISFTMKSINDVTDKSIGHSDESNNVPHSISLSAYLIGETEVTQELWEKVMGAENNPSNFKGSSYPPDSNEVQGKRPVEKVSWYECIAFCNELTKQVSGLGTGECVYYGDASLNAVYTVADAASYKDPHVKWSAKGFRLPTEAEWEWAATGGTEDKWAGTDEKNELVNYAWYKNNDGGDANGKTHEVKKKTANSYGLYDMSGNVWEWCWDRYGNLPDPMEKDYTGPISGSPRIFRGGCWGSNADYAARSFRYGRNPAYYDINLGLRLVSRF